MAEKLTQMLADGWAVEGYSTTIMAAGAMTHSILLRKDAQLESVTIVVNGGSELGRQFTRFAPVAEAPVKKGFW